MANKVKFVSVRAIRKCWYCVRFLIVLIIPVKNIGVRTLCSRSIRLPILELLKRLENLIFLFIFLLAMGMLHFLITLELSKPPLKPLTNINYLGIPPSIVDDDLLVNTTQCKIPDLGPWDPSIISQIVKLNPQDFACDTKVPHWTYVKGNDLILNVTAIKGSGYRPEDLDCCYQSIHRMKQDPNNYNRLADRLVRYSAKCYTMGLITPIITAEHIHVTCRFRFQFWMDETSIPVLYKNFHPIAQPNRDGVEQILQFWEKSENRQEHPPNVILIVMDSTSRLNFRRGMFETQKILEGIGAHEMLGYTKVGENTYPNAVPLATGYDDRQIDQLCHYERLTKYDDCPLIWKSFKDANYMTAFVEDSPTYGIFHFTKTGFVVQPTDFYARPIMLAAHQAVKDYPDSIDCVGYSTVDQFLLKYLSDLIGLSNSKKLPLFVTFWLTQLTHNADDALNNLQIADKDYARLLQKLLARRWLDNSILFFMSDHGYRYGTVRNTMSGWYEDRLPNMWIWLSQNIRQKYPQWEEALSKNQRRLSSPYDLYHTLVHILQIFSNVADIPPAPMRNGSTIPRIYGQSFFKLIPKNRTCASAGIPENYCACAYPYLKVDLEDPILQQGAKAAIEEINKSLPPQCIKFALSKVVGGAVTSSANDADNPNGPKIRQYIINFETLPGHFLYEATIQHKQLANGSFKIGVAGIIQRLSKINTDVSCVDTSKMQLYCYCDPIAKLNE